MENLTTIQPLPPPHGLRLGPSSVNRDRDLSSPSYTVTSLDEDQNLQGLEQIHSGPDEIEECPSRTQDDWMISIKDELEHLHNLDDITNWSKVCIYRVPKDWNKKIDKSYCPQTVSLGPYYHGEEHLQSMEFHKGRAVNKILTRRKQCIEMYIEAMRELEEKARACYEGVIRMTSNDFTKMLVFDGCFVLEILRGAFKGFEKTGYARNDPVFAMREYMSLIQRDMIMLENQLPLFVLDRLLALQYVERPQTVLVLAHLVINFFEPLILRKCFFNGSKIDEINLSEEMVHCLDVFRQNLFLPTLHGTKWYGGSCVVDKRLQHMVHSVTKLRAVGTKFRRRNTHHFWDIKFENGYLDIPELFIHEGTESLFLNLIAFEQSHLNSTNDITSYMIFMNNLIDSEEDVSYLQKCGIIENWLETDSEVADLFNQIGRLIIVFNPSDNYLCNLSQAVASYYDDRLNYFRKLNETKLNAWVTILKEKYFDSPWAYISFFAAFILLVLTFLQCYYAAYDHYHPSS